MTQARIQGKFYPLQHEEWLRVCKELTPSQIDVLYFIRTLDPNGESLLPRVTEIAKVLKLDKATVSRALKTLGQQGYIDWQPTNKDNIEQQVRDRLQFQLGGLIEVATPAGRIDLLTDTEIIEVKHVSEWKSAMGQVLAYSGFYPEHGKRIHLWGRKGEMASATALVICLELNIAVTFEEVQL
jgi:DNA-binding transcriptional ArsR family regulator